MTEKMIVLSSYDGSAKVKFGEKEYPIDAVCGFRLDKDGEIAWISLDTETLNNGSAARQSAAKHGAQRIGLWAGFIIGFLLGSTLGTWSFLLFIANR